MGEAEFYAIRELRFTKRQMLWITHNLYSIRLGEWPVKPENYVEMITDAPAAGKKQAMRTLHTRPARFERAAQIAAEIDWRLNQCKTKHGDYAVLYLEIYLNGQGIDEVAKRHHLDTDVVDMRVSQVLAYISGWKRKPLNMEHYKQRRVKGYGQRKTQ